jgi:dolichyl-diphosphooligosaccharide--protein glycosyltransferase
MHNYFASGEASSYTFARERYEPFLSATSEEAAWEQLDGRRGYVVTTDREGFDSDMVQTRLHQHYGSAAEGVNGLGHFRAVYASEDGRYKTFRAVKGARLTGPASGESVTISRQVSIDGASFTYRREVPVQHGVYEVTIPYGGEYVVGPGTVAVPRDVSTEGGLVSTFGGEGVAYWSFDEGEGQRVYDRSGGYHATAVNASWADGIGGSAVVTSRNDDSRVVVSRFDGPNKSFTVSLWIRPGEIDTTDGNDFRRLVAGRSGRMLVIEESGGLSFRLPGGSDEPLNGGEAPVDEWTHIVISYDGSRKALYIDGKQVATQSVEVRTARWGGLLQVGASKNDDTSRTFTGRIDELRVYGEALSDDEVRSLYERY